MDFDKPFFARTLLPLFLGVTLLTLPACQKAKFERKNRETRRDQIRDDDNRVTPDTRAPGVNNDDNNNDNDNEKEVLDDKGGDDSENEKEVLDDEEGGTFRPREVTVDELVTFGRPGPKIDALDNCYVGAPIPSGQLDCGPPYIHTTIEEPTQPIERVVVVSDTPIQTVDPVPGDPCATDEPCGAPQREIVVQFESVEGVHPRIDHVNIYLVIDPADSFKNDRHQIPHHLKGLLKSLPEWVTFNVALVAGTAAQGLGSLYTNSCDPGAAPQDDCWPSQNQPSVPMVYSSFEYTNTSIDPKDDIPARIDPVIKTMDLLKITDDIPIKGRMGLYALQFLLQKKADMLRDVGLTHTKKVANMVVFLSDKLDLCLSQSTAGNDNEQFVKDTYCKNVSPQNIETLVRQNMLNTADYYSVMIYRNFGNQLTSAGMQMANMMKEQDVSNSFTLNASEAIDPRSIQFRTEDDTVKACRFDRTTNTVYVEDAGVAGGKYYIEYATLAVTNGQYTAEGERGCEPFEAARE